MIKKRILHIIKSLGRGGAEVLLPETLKLHDTERFEFHYIYFLPWKNQMASEIEGAGGKVICFPASNNIKMVLQYREIITYCNTNSIDLIHCHLPWSGFLGRLIFLRTLIPVIYTEHNIQERYHFATRNLNKITFNHQSLAIGVSKDVTRSIKKNIDPKIPVSTLLNGVNTDSFKKNTSKGASIRKYLKIPENAIVIGNISVFRKQKSIPVWIRSFKEINQKYPEVYGILVGAGPQEMEIKNLIKKMGLTDKIILPGLQTNTVDFLSAFNIFMLTSSFEGLPIALLEAMSNSCAIVSTKAGGVVEVVRENIDGYLCEVGDWRSLAAKATHLIEDQEKMEEFQNSARSRVVNNFSLKTMVEKLENIYSALSKEDKKK